MVRDAGRLAAALARPVRLHHHAYAMTTDRTTIWDVLPLEDMSDGLPHAEVLAAGFRRLPPTTRQREFDRIAHMVADWPAGGRLLATTVLAEVAVALDLHHAPSAPTPAELAVAAESLTADLILRLANTEASGPLGAAIVARVLDGLTGAGARARLEAAIHAQRRRIAPALQATGRAR